jgi:hypothetical protein
MPVVSLWFTGLFITALLPGEAKVRMGTIPRTGPSHSSHVPPAHRIAHFLGFGTSAALLILLAEDEFAPWRAGSPAFLAGLVIECVQAVIYQGYFEWWDLRDDAYAVTAVVLTWEVVLRVKARQETAHGKRN